MIGIFVTFPRKSSGSPIPVFDAVKCLEKDGAGDINSQNRHQYLKPVTIIYRFIYKIVIQAGISFELFSLEVLS